MNKIFKKVLSCVIALALVTASAVALKAMPVKAASGVTIYFNNANTKWSQVYCYLFTGSGDNGLIWPGTQMTDLGNGWFSFTYTGTDPIDPVFNDNGSNQTNNCTEMDTSSSAVYYVPTTEENNAMSHSIAWNLDVTTDPAAAGFGETFYFKNTLSSMTAPCWYSFDTTNGNATVSSAWPGDDMKDLGNGWFSYTYTGTVKNLTVQIVDKNDNSIKTTNTDNLTCDSSKYYLVPDGSTSTGMGNTITNDVTLYKDAASAGFPVVNSSSSSSSSSKPATASSSKAATTSSSKTAATSSESSVANPKTGATTPIAAGSVVVLASIAVLGIALAKKKSK